ncbi:hypothetical protein BC2230_30867 [Burkholderia cepacia]
MGAFDVDGYGLRMAISDGRASAHGRAPTVADAGTPDATAVQALSQAAHGITREPRATNRASGSA